MRDYIIMTDSASDLSADKAIELGVELVATQLANESDSFGNDYDAESDGQINILYSFNSNDDLLAFAPTAGDVASTGLSITEDGKAQIDKSGAWYTVDAALSQREYSVEYDIDITHLSVGENITVDTGKMLTTDYNGVALPLCLKEAPQRYITELLRTSISVLLREQWFM